MNYEQKYKDALERARNLHKDAIDMGESLCAKQCEIIFPELKEGEWIRKRLITFFQRFPYTNLYDNDLNAKDIIAWLEEQKTSEEAMQYLKENHSPSEVSDFQSAMNIAVAKAYDKGIKDGLEKQGKTNVAQTESHDYVEIGGVKWATMNVGANAITDKGLYFQWGDTQGYTASQLGTDKEFSWDDYKYGKYNYSGSNRGMTKYNETDSKTVLDPSDDAVTAAWGGNWRMPTHEEFQALFEATTSEWVENYNGSGVNGRLFTDKTDSSKTLFFPAAGGCGGGAVWDVGNGGYYWSRSLDTGYVNGAWRLDFSDGYVDPGNDNYRYQGYSVRGVMNC